MNTIVPANLPPPPDLPRGVRVTTVFSTLWKFAAERQEVFFRRLAGWEPPWTSDQILHNYRFTNVFRASDRVSQYLIRNVIDAGAQSPPEVFFRIILFKIFNRIETWELLRHEMNEISWSTYSFARYDAVLTKALDDGFKIYSAAYIMPSGQIADRKHRYHLHLIERMMSDELPLRLQNCETMQSAFELLLSYPSIGNFLAYQFITDFNYSGLVNFSEMEFVKAGPGALDGLHKCFDSMGSWSAEDLIRWMVETQEGQFLRLNPGFRNLWARPLQLIDCQNLLCEVDKYSRYAHPEITGISGRVRIKQRFTPKSPLTEYIFPEKWHINENARRFGADWALVPTSGNVNAAD